MSLSTNVTNLATRVGTEVKALRTLLNANAADLSALTTTAKGNLVAAINELQAALANAGAHINDAATNTTETWSSSKISTQITAALSALTTGAPAALDTLDELAAALGAVCSGHDDAYKRGGLRQLFCLFDGGCAPRAGRILVGEGDRIQGHLDEWNNSRVRVFYRTRGRASRYPFTLPAVSPPTRCRCTA